MFKPSLPESVNKTPFFPIYLKHASVLVLAMALVSALAGCTFTSQVDELIHHNAIEAARFQAIVNDPIRTEDDRKDDLRRHPVEFLQFAELQPGMQVLDISAGSGYTAQLLALAAGSGGRVWAQVEKTGPKLEKRLTDHPQPNLMPRQRPTEDPVPADAPKLDLITIVLSYHDISFSPVDRTRMNRRLFEALKPGGHLVIIDHSTKPGSGISQAKTLHRIDEQFVINEIRQAGFELEKQSDFLRNPADPREQAFFNMKIPTDRFALRFVKPS